MKNDFMAVFITYFALYRVFVLLSETGRTSWNMASKNQHIHRHIFQHREQSNVVSRDCGFVFHDFFDFRLLETINSTVG